MRIKKFAAAIGLGVSAVALSACAESISTTVSRYQAMPAPQGQTFFVVPVGGMANNGGLEFQRYAGIVAQQLQARGYAPATDARSANMIVQFGYGIDRGQARYVSSPGFPASRTCRRTRFGRVGSARSRGSAGRDCGSSRCCWGSPW